MATQVIRSIGAGATRDFPSMAAWVATIPADLIAADQEWIGEIYNDVPGTYALAAENAEFVLPSKTTDATRRVVIRPGPGQGFKDSSTLDANPLRLDPAVGVAIGTVNFGSVCCDISAAWTLIEGLQIGWFEQQPGSMIDIKASATDCTVKDCIFESPNGAGAANNVKAGGLRFLGINLCGIIMSNDPAGLASTGANPTWVNCTAYNGDPLPNLRSGMTRNYDTPSAVNCASFNFNTGFNSWSGTGCNNNASDSGAVPGVNSITGLVTADQFVAATFGNQDTIDLRLNQFGGALIGAGIVDARAPKDIYGRSRAAVGQPCAIGCWEPQSSGPGDITGGLAATEQRDTAAFAGTASDTGALGATERRDAASFPGSMIPSFRTGTLAATEQRDAFVATGDSNPPNQTVGGLAVTEQRDTAAFAGNKVFSGTLGATEQRDAASFPGSMIPSFRTGTLAATEQRDTYASTGDINQPGTVSGGLAANESRDTAAFAGAKTFFGTLAATEQRDTARFPGSMIPSFRTGTLSATEARDVFAAIGDAFSPGSIGGSLLATEARDAAAFSGLKTFYGALAATEARDRAAFNGFVFKLVSGTMAATEARDVAFMNGDDLEEDEVANTLALRDANTGIGVSPDQPWRDGAPRNNDGVNIPTAIGQPASPDNFMNLNGVMRQARLIQAIADTPAGVAVIPGWVSNIALKAGEWGWCFSLTAIVSDSDNPIGMPSVVGT